MIILFLAHLEKKTNTTNSVFGFNAQFEAVRNSFLQSNSSDKLSEEVKSALATIEKVLDMNITGNDYKGNGKLDIIHSKLYEVRQKKTQTLILA